MRWDYKQSSEMLLSARRRVVGCKIHFFSPVSLYERIFLYWVIQLTGWKQHSTIMFASALLCLLCCLHLNITSSFTFPCSLASNAKCCRAGGLLFNLLTNTGCGGSTAFPLSCQGQDHDNIFVFTALLCSTVQNCKLFSQIRTSSG